MTPTQRSLAYMREHGYLCEVTERWNPFAKIRQDLYGFIDVLCVGEDIVGVQTTTKENMKARINKIANHDNYAAVIASGMRIVVHGWHKKDNRWNLEIFEF